MFRLIFFFHILRRNIKAPTAAVRVCAETYRHQIVYPAASLKNQLLYFNYAKYLQ